MRVAAWHVSISTRHSPKRPKAYASSRADWSIRSFSSSFSYAESESCDGTRNLKKPSPPCPFKKIRRRLVGLVLRRNLRWKRFGSLSTITCDTKQHLPRHLERNPPLHHFHNNQYCYLLVYNHHSNPNGTNHNRVQRSRFSRSFCSEQYSSSHRQSWEWSGCHKCISIPHVPLEPLSSPTLAESLVRSLYADSFERNQKRIPLCQYGFTIPYNDSKHVFITRYDDWIEQKGDKQKGGRTRDRSVVPS